MYRLTDEIGVVNTVDFFTPVVDDPFTYGQISAANSLSDIYAMGATPKTALNIVCWPQSGLPGEMLGEILRGGAEKAREAGVVIVGGHSVADEEVKYGMAVTGVVDPRRIVRNVGARVGDALLLTKPLGTGVLMTAFKRDRLAAEHYEAAVRSMTLLNAGAARAMLRHDVHAATDITGFGLLGHAWELAKGSGVTVEINAAQVPLIRGALEMARRKMLTSGDKKNREYVGDDVFLDTDITKEMASLLYDPQTAGGMLISIARDKADALLARLRESYPDAAFIGRVTEKGARSLVVI